MRLPATAAVALAIALPLGSAEAAQPPRVPGYQCQALAAEIGAANVWHTWFRGEKTDLFDHVSRYWVTACFRTETNCKAWLYWAQSDWPEHNTFRPCRRGIGD